MPRLPPLPPLVKDKGYGRGAALLIELDFYGIDCLQFIKDECEAIGEIARGRQDGED
jgi:hypothetical protein